MHLLAGLTQLSVLHLNDNPVTADPHGSQAKATLHALLPCLSELDLELIPPKEALGHLARAVGGAPTVVVGLMQQLGPLLASGGNLQPVVLSAAWGGGRTGKGTRPTSAPSQAQHAQQAEGSQAAGLVHAAAQGAARMQALLKLLPLACPAPPHSSGGGASSSQYFYQLADWQAREEWQVRVWGPVGYTTISYKLTGSYTARTFTKPSQSGGGDTLA